jgi:hypothetical protein
MTKEHNPFTDCTAQGSEHGTGWSVCSMYWNIMMPNQGVAERVAELIRMSYFAGQRDAQNEIKKVLGITNG